MNNLENIYVKDVNGAISINFVKNASKRTVNKFIIDGVLLGTTNSNLEG